MWMSNMTQNINDDRCLFYLARTGICVMEMRNEAINCCCFNIHYSSNFNAMDSVKAEEKEFTFVHNHCGFRQFTIKPRRVFNFETFRKIKRDHEVN